MVITSSTNEKLYSFYWIFPLFTSFDTQDGSSIPATIKMNKRSGQSYMDWKWMTQTLISAYIHKYLKCSYSYWTEWVTAAYKQMES